MKVSVGQSKKKTWMPRYKMCFFNHFLKIRLLSIAWMFQPTQLRSYVLSIYPELTFILSLLLRSACYDFFYWITAEPKIRKLLYSFCTRRIQNSWMLGSQFGHLNYIHLVKQREHDFNYGMLIVSKCHCLGAHHQTIKYYNNGDQIIN